MTSTIDTTGSGPASPQGNLAAAVVAFCRLLRAKGIKLHADASQTAMVVLAEIDITKRYDFRNGLLVALLQRPEDRPLFIYLFNAFWFIAASHSSQPIDNALSVLGRPLDQKGSLQRSDDENQKSQIQ